MEKIALLSRHIVLTELIDSTDRCPQSGIVLIINSKIHDIILRSDPDEYEHLKVIYSDWNIVDYSDFYISPGLIDLNARTEWEDTAALSLIALNSGITTIVIEPGYYNSQQINNNVHCNVFHVQTIDESLSSQLDFPNQTVLKGYLFPPSRNIKSFSNIDQILNAAQKFMLPLFIDPTLPDPRMIFMASPLRLEGASDRVLIKEKHSFSSFATAFMQEEKLSDEEDDLKSLPKIDELEAKHSEKAKNVSQKAVNLNKMFMKMDLNEETKFQSINQKINQLKNDNEDLFKAETSTYAYSSTTKPKNQSRKLSDIEDLLFAKKNELSPLCFSSINSELIQSPPSNLVNRRKNRFNSTNLIPINTSKTPQSDSSNYNHYLANFPVDWEINGVKKVLEFLSDSSQVHFCGLSSAATFNLIRQAKKTCRNVSSEIACAYLSFNSQFVGNGDTRFKNNPPIRNHSNNALLWELLKLKAIDNVTSAHAYIDPELKLTKSFQNALNGISSLGCSLQSVWFNLNKPGTSQQKLESLIVNLSEWMSLNPAKVLKIDKSRGSIAKGKIADLIIWDPWEKYKLKEDCPYSSTTPYKDYWLMGRIKQVYFEGKAKLSK